MVLFRSQGMVLRSYFFIFSAIPLRISSLRDSEELTMTIGTRVVCYNAWPAWNDGACRLRHLSSNKAVPTNEKARSRLCPDVHTRCCTAFSNPHLNRCSLHAYNASWWSLTSNDSLSRRGSIMSSFAGPLFESPLSSFVSVTSGWSERNSKPDIHHLFFLTLALRLRGDCLQR